MAALQKFDLRLVVIRFLIIRKDDVFHPTHKVRGPAKLVYSTDLAIERNQITLNIIGIRCLRRQSFVDFHQTPNDMVQQARIFVGL